MPTLDFKGKQFVYAHQLSVPYRTLEMDRKKSFPAKDAPEEGNLIIHGDNLHALKALMPRYAGRVNCIYIDPPYNTGNEGWVYNDNVNSDLMKRWLKENGEVDREDPERHDKWLCMMWPRLQLLRELLAEDGVIFISIDDNEQHRLRLLVDEIFGEENFVANIIWQKKYSPANDAEYFSDNHDFVVCYAKNKSKNGDNGEKTTAWERNLLPRTAKADKLYKYDDQDGRGPWQSGDLSVKTYSPEYDYPIVNPSTGKEYNPPEGRCWITSREQMQVWIDGNRIFFPPGGKSVPRMKRYLKEVQQGIVPLTIWTYDEVGHTDGARKLIKEIFSDRQKPFDNPKAFGLLQRIISIGANKDAIILDSFAGSGTTAHAVLALNQQDGGNRKFILVECEDYADSITAERVRRIISGYKYTTVEKTELMSENLTWAKIKKATGLTGQVEEVEDLYGNEYDRIKKTVKDSKLIVTGEKDTSEQANGLGGSFTYYTLGEELNIENLITGKSIPDYDALARHVTYTATGVTLEKIKSGKDYLFGETEDYCLYMIYRPDLTFLRSAESALTLDLAGRIGKTAQQKNKTALVFAPWKFVSQKDLSKQKITFCQLPYAIHRLFGD
ncbi:MAG: site-specific DNA-methyltransferase [Gammaproteobacteria bacterium]|nr:site-specific DNA-methyltransferase [Gammaproteobacteria bacterium]